MSRNGLQQIRRIFTSGLLVFLQVHLLGIAMLHWHGETLSPDHNRQVDNHAIQPLQSSDSSIPCTACQIVHNGAAGPAEAAQVLPSLRAVTLVRLNTPSVYHSEFLAVNHGRAPPLA